MDVAVTKAPAVVRGERRQASGGLIDRGHELGFTFDGQALRGYRGDTLASALLANGIRLVGRSFKYHRPRGILSAGAEEPNALVELGTGAGREPNTKATTIELREGLTAASQNRWPSLSLDLMAVNDLLSPLFCAGFYYKTFMWPASFWERVYEPAIRRAAGLGRASAAADSDEYDKAHDFCDVLVVGTGAAGLAAALTAARAGARVLVCEQDFLCGGRLLSGISRIDGQAGHEWAASAIRSLSEMPNVRVMTRTAVFGCYDDGTCGALETLTNAAQGRAAGRPCQRYWKIVARRIVVAAGATERMIAFGGNDRPGVMTASAVRTYAHRFAVRPGERAAIFTSNDSGWSTAKHLLSAGIEVAAIVDTRATVSVQAPGDIRVILGAQVADASGGRNGIRSVDIESSQGRERIRIDLLAVSGGWNPNAELATHRGARLTWSPDARAFVCQAPPAEIILAGSANARWTLAECLADGQHAGAQAASASGFEARREALPDCSTETSAGEVFWRSRAARGKAFVDPQHDVTTADIELAAREGYDRPEHLKRYTTLGMATDQGRTSGVVGQGVLSEVLGRALEDLGTTSARPPAVPVALGAISHRHRGKRYRPTRLTPTHDWAQANGAVFGPAGTWLRARYYKRTEDVDALAAVNREVSATRGAVGICDVSSLGKVDVQGTDVTAFLDFVYANRISTLPVGRARYGLMLREDGLLFDDGTVSRLGSEHFLLSTTTLHAEAVLRHLEYCHQVLSPRLDVRITPVTDQWAQLAIAGPRARELLNRIVDSRCDVSNAAFPFLAAADVTICGGVTARLFRISFSGELAYELAVPARYGEALLRRLLEQGASLGATPYGTEALNVMRIEKGFVGGAEINGQVTATDLGLGKWLSPDKDYVGRVLLQRAGLMDPLRPALVGLRPVDERTRFRAGAHLCASLGGASPRDSEGHVTSVAYSPTLGGWIGLALLARGPARIGEVIQVCDPLQGSETRARVCQPAFFDPEGQRVRA